MEKLKDYTGRDVEVGDTVIVESYSQIYIGKVSHYTNAGNVVVIMKPEVNSAYNETARWNRTVVRYNSERKFIITQDPNHVAYVQDIKVKG